MKRNILSVMLLFLTATTYAQHSSNANQDGSNSNVYQRYNQRYVSLDVNMNNYNNNQVALKAEVMVNVLPDAFVVILSATQINESITEAEHFMNERLQLVKTELQKIGITEKDVHIDFISCVPRYETETEERKFSITTNEIPVGFELKKNIHVRIKGLDLVNGIIEAASKAEIYDVAKVEYVVNDIDAVYNQLRQKAFEVVNKKKMAYENSGMRLKTSRVGEEKGSAYPHERYRQYTASNTGTSKYIYTLNKKKNIQHNYAEKPRTTYYEKIPHNQFDHVFNPDLKEPSVQFFMAVQINYDIINEDAEKQRLSELQYQEKLRDLELKKKEAEIEMMRTKKSVASNNK